MAIKIVHLYPTELNLYSDYGNIICITKKLSQLGYDFNITSVGVGDTIPNFDFMLIGGGQDREMRILSNDIRRKAPSLSYYIEQNKTILAICGGYQMLGEYYKINDEIIHLSGVLPFYTVAGDYRMIGNFAYSTSFGSVVGFENHSGRTFLCGNLNPLGNLLYGYGNNGYDYSEGVLYKNTFGTYAHGPLLPKNPSLTNEILSRILGDKISINDELEEQCHNYILNKFI